MRIQTKQEELWNAITHGFGSLLGISGLVILLVYATNKPYSLFSVLVYSISVIVLFTASTLYHSVTSARRKHVFRIIDHISIYLLIAGTYTPITLVLLRDSSGWKLFITVWIIAAIGVVLKLFYTGKFEIFSTILYLIMGWLIVLDFSAVSTVLSNVSLNFMIAGGLAYTIGIVFYAIERIPYNHVIWHMFVLAGAISHWFMVFFSLL